MNNSSSKEETEWIYGMNVLSKFIGDIMIHIYLV